MADRDESCWVLWSEIVDSKNADPYIRGGPIISRQTPLPEQLGKSIKGER